jgi:hypothetical protein
VTIFVRVRVRNRTPTAPQRPGLRRVRTIRRGLRSVSRFLVLLCHLLIWLPVLYVVLAVLFTGLHPSTDTGNHRPTYGTHP